MNNNIVNIEDVPIHNIPTDFGRMGNLIIESALMGNAAQDSH